MQTPLTGILPVAPTPFHDDGSIDTDGMRRVLDCMIDQGVDAICILANYSEQFVLTDAERATLTKVSLEHVAGRVPVIVTISHFATEIVVNRAKEAQSLGASMLMMMPPYHGVGLVPAEAGIFEHYLSGFRCDLHSHHGAGCTVVRGQSVSAFVGKNGKGNRECFLFQNGNALCRRQACSAD